MNRALIIQLLCVVSTALISSLSHANSTAEKDFQYLNNIRSAAQLNVLSWNQALTDAAKHHAQYLTTNNRYGHNEQKGLTHYTGQWASDRSIAAQYPHRLVSENVSSKSGENLFFNPIDNLMTALYHRLGFLDFNIDEIGIGHQQGLLNSYVYVMGNSVLSKLCKQPSFTGYGAYSYDICSQRDKRIEKELADNTKIIHQSSNPKLVIWPPQNAQNITPAFYQESPDPLPHHSVSGYPISIQFNPTFYKKPPIITTFTVRQTEQPDNLKAITVMNEKNDPNRKLTAYQHAFFPEHRLDWDSSYTVNINYTNQDNGQEHHLNWRFYTQKFKAPLLHITQSKHTIKVNVGQHYILYFPPQNAHDSRTAVRIRDQNMQLKLNYIDNNTLNVYISQQGKAEINFHNKTVELFAP